jgi:general secretion pathway protein J
MKPPRVTGFTLLEVLVALGVFAVVTLLAWRGLDIMTTAKARLDAEMRGWRELELVFERLNMDLTQITPRTWTDKGNQIRSPIQGTGSDDGASCQLDLLRFGNDNEPLHARYRVADGRLTLEFPAFAYSATASQPGATQEPYLLLQGVSRCELTFIDNSNATLKRWPAGDADDMTRPRGLRLHLTLNGRGDFERVYFIP